MKRTLGERLAMGVIAGLVAFGIAYWAHPRGGSVQRAHMATLLEARGATFELHPGAAQITVRSRDGAMSRDVDLMTIVDGAPQPFNFARDDLHGGADFVRTTVPITIDDSTVELTLELRVDRARDALAIDLAAPASLEASNHSVGLRAELASGGDVVFVSGIGQIADRATVSGPLLLVDADPHPLAILSTGGPIAVDAVPENTAAPVEPLHVSVSSPAAGGDEHPRANLTLVLGASSMSVWRTVADVSGIPTAPVRGRVAGSEAAAARGAPGQTTLVLGRDNEGLPRVRAHADANGAFALDVPTSIVQWYAAIDPGRSSGLASFVPGTPHELVLDVSPGGDLHVTVVDSDSRAPLTARLLVHGVDGTVDPSFGPDYRASGAGPVIDALRGDVTTPLPSGHYRVAATKGIEWTVDAQTIVIAPGHSTDLTLAPRHVVPTPGVIGCDLHVHARPSFDTPVTPEDRVISLVAAGIEFAVPTEHNLVGDYTSALATLDLGRELLSVPGVEVTTYSKGFGHFGVFPYAPALPVPPFKHTSMGAIFRAVRTDPTRFFQLNHPRLPKGIGYFNNIGFDPKAPRAHVHARIDFDGIEVFNGYDNEFPDRVDQVLHDYWALLDFGWRYAATGSSDSHRIQFHWAGYPRTMVMVDPAAAAAGADSPADAGAPDAAAAAAGEAKTIDPLAVVAAIKKGHSFVTSGPVLEFDVAGVRPGDELQTEDDTLHAHLRVRAAPWIDVTHIDIVVGEVGATHRVVQSFDVPSRPTVIGSDPSPLAEAQERTIRFDSDLEISTSAAGAAARSGSASSSASSGDPGPPNAWIQVVVRGDRRMDDVLPFMPVAPLAFTNPVYVVRRPVPQPPFPGAPGPRP
jgi:hypothetical protein